jgi:hypothetical protein
MTNLYTLALVTTDSVLIAGLISFAFAALGILIGVLTAVYVNRRGRP